MSAALERARADLEHVFGGFEDSLDRPLSILKLQIDALAQDPGLEGLPEAARLAAVARIRAGRPVIEPARFPVDPLRTAALMRRLCDVLLGDVSGLAVSDLGDLVERAFGMALSGDGDGVIACLGELDLPVETSSALLREALKPELLRTAFALQSVLVTEPQHSGRCPACGSPARTGNLEPVLCCGWCGCCWRWTGGECVSCGDSALRRLEIERLDGAHLLTCRSCAFALVQFEAAPEPLTLSMLGVLAAPFQLAARVQAGGAPERGFPLF